MQRPDAPVAIAPDGSQVRVLLRLDGGSMAHFRAGRRTGLPGGRPPRRGRALVRPVRPRPDVAAPAGTAGDGAAPARHLPVHPGGHALPVPRRRRRAAGRGGRDDATLAGRSRGVRGPRSVASRATPFDDSPGNARLPWPDAGRSRRIAFAARGGGHATRARAGVAAAETSRQPCGGADGRAGGGAGQGFPLANQVRRRAGEGREPAGLGDQRRAVPGRRSLLLQVREAGDHDRCRTHAEQRAITLAREGDGWRMLQGSKLIYVRLEADDSVRLDEPHFCARCSRLALSLGVARVDLRPVRGAGRLLLGRLRPDRQAQVVVVGR